MPDRGAPSTPSEQWYEAALEVVKKADAYRMMETGVLNRALGIRPPTDSEIETTRAALDKALDGYLAVCASEALDA